MPGHAATSDIVTEDISAEEIARIFPRFEITMIDNPKVTKGFYCFAVNKHGDYALGFNAGPFQKKDYILVYSAEGSFLYGFSFLDNGLFGLELSDKEVVLYKYRSNLVVTIDATGKCLSMQSYQDSAENNEYIKAKIQSNTREIDGNIYTAKAPFLNHKLVRHGCYRQIVKTTATSKQIIWSVKTVSLSAVLGVCVILVLFAPVVLIIIKQLAKGVAQKTD